MEQHPARWPFPTYKGKPYRPPKPEPKPLPDAPF